MPRYIVLDANVFASALIKPTGIPGVIISNLIRSGDTQAILTPSIMSEIERILFYPKVRKYISLNDDEIKNWIEAFSIISYFFVPKYHYKPIVLEDPDDDIYLIAAIEGHASVVVSGDKHLLKLGAYKGIKILSPKEYYEKPD